MNLKELKAKPQLIQVTVDDPMVVEAYGEPVEFWMYDRQDLPTFLKLSQVNDNREYIMEIVRELVLDEKGKPILEEGDVLDIEILMKVIEAVVTRLGNFRSQTSAA